MLGGYLKYWSANHWAWVRPRVIPMLVAVAGMFAVLGATRYLSNLAHGDPRPSILVTSHAHGDAGADQPRCAGTRAPAAGTTAISGDAARDKSHVAPDRPSSRDVPIHLGL